MKHLRAIIQSKRYSFLIGGGIILLLFSSLRINGQEDPPSPEEGGITIPEAPPRPLTVSNVLTQNLNFGAFYHGSAGGTVIIYPDGSRSSTGDVVLLSLGYTFSAGLFDVVAYPGTLISILVSPGATLTGSNGGTMTLQLGDTDPPNPFIITTEPPNATQFRIGGTLIVGSALANPPGNYSGMFNITLVQE